MVTTRIALKLIDSKLNSKTIKVQAQENMSSIKTFSPSRFINNQILLKLLLSHSIVTVNITELTSDGVSRNKRCGSQYF